jgi:error-prone DNA polymerase
MKIAMVAAGFTPGEADQLRRSMAAWKKRGGLEHFEDKLIGGMLERGYERQFAEQVFNQIKGFGDYGFPESHSASFALLAYVSCWLKHYEPAAFCCGLLNSQPMGFYRPAQLVIDAIRHGVEVRPVDVNESKWDCHLEPSRGKQPALRLGLRMVKGLNKEAGEKVVMVRSNAKFKSLQDLAQRSNLDQKALGALAASDALAAISGHRHRAYWEVAGIEEPTDVLGVAEFNEAAPMLPKPGQWQNTLADYASTGLTLGEHPLSQLREMLNQKGIVTNNMLNKTPTGRRVSVAGLVINRQRPGTASGVMFSTLEDETGQANIVIWPKIIERQRKILLTSRLLIVTGEVQTESNVTHLIAHRLADGTGLVRGLRMKSRDFH